MKIKRTKYDFALKHENLASRKKPAIRFMWLHELDVRLLKGAGRPISSQMNKFFPRKLTGVFLSTLHHGFITSKAIFIPTLCFIGYTAMFL